MQENKEISAELLNTLLENTDRLYQQNSLLKSKLEDRTDVDALKSTYEQTISKLEEKIFTLESQVAYLKKRIWGQSSERFINKDPKQRVIDFEGMDILPEEKELAQEAQKEIESLQKRRKKEKIKKNQCASLYLRIFRALRSISIPSRQKKIKKIGLNWSLK